MLMPMDARTNTSIAQAAVWMAGWLTLMLVIAVAGREAARELSVFQIMLRSVTCTSARRWLTFCISVTPSASSAVSRKTAACFCIVRCICRRMSAVGEPPFAARNLSTRVSAKSAASFGSALCGAPGVNEDFRCKPVARPNTTKSINEFDPRRFAPCTETQAASPTE